MQLEAFKLGLVGSHNRHQLVIEEEFICLLWAEDDRAATRLVITKLISCLVYESVVKWVSPEDVYQHGLRFGLAKAIDLIQLLHPMQTW